ncbi:MAG: outer membrane lipoprotein carrier protein LolA [Bacteroidota bacterium]
MKKFLAICLTIICITTQTVSAQNDPKAKAVLEGVSKKINSLKSLKANFALHLTDAKGKVKETKKGSFSMKGRKYHVSLNGQEIICDTKTVWTYMKETNEVQVSAYNPNEQTLSPDKLFTNFYDKEYSYKFVGEKKINGKNCDVLELMPLNKSKQFTKLELVVDKATTTISGGSYWEKNGNKYQYEISGFTPNATISDASFVFDKAAHPGVEVVDLK